MHRHSDNLRLHQILFVLTIAIWILSVGLADAAAPETSLYVCDTNRILKFAPPFTNGMSATVVLGQTDFVSSNPGLGPNLLNAPNAIDHDAAGNLFVSDLENNRILEFAQPITTGESASLVIGQPDFTSNNKGFAFNQTRNPNGVAIDRRGTGALYVSVQDHVREFMLPFSNGMNASLQLGNDGSTAQMISPPTGVSLNGNGDLFVSDFNNQRVLEFKPLIYNNKLASVVLGADSLDHVGHGVFSEPQGSAVDSHGDLWVADPTTIECWNSRRHFGTISSPRW